MRQFQPRDDVVVGVSIVRDDLNNPHRIFEEKNLEDLMSIPTKDQVDKFLAPLVGNLTILLLHGTDARAQLSRFLLRCAASQLLAASILDTDAFYCTNLDRFIENAGYSAELMLLPEGDFQASSVLSLVSSKIRFLVIDDLNSLYSLASDRKSSHQLMASLRLLSYNAQVNKSWVIATAFRTEPIPGSHRPNQRSLTSLGDLVVYANIQGNTLSFRAELNGLWQSGLLEI